MAELSASARRNLSPDQFVFPKDRRYPIPDASHARNALARVAANGTEAEKEKVEDAVHAKFPSIGDDDEGTEKD